MRWECAACGFDNAATLVCDACGVAKRHFDDPPVDIPARPRWSEIGAAYLAGTYALLAAAGATVVAVEPLRAAVGLRSEWLLLESGLAAAAAYGASVHAVWLRRFNQARLDAPTTVRTGLPFEAALTLVPYESLERVWVTIELVERYFETVTRQGRRTQRTRARVIERSTLQSGEPLAGRRVHRFEATLHTALPSTAHGNVQAEITASVAAFFAPLVPGLGHHARNLRQHGGYFVRARVRSGLWRRSYEERIISVAVPFGSGGGSGDRIGTVPGGNDGVAGGPPQPQPASAPPSPASSAMEPASGRQP